MELQELKIFYGIRFHPITIHARIQQAKILDKFYFTVRLYTYRICGCYDACPEFFAARIFLTNPKAAEQILIHGGGGGGVLRSGALGEYDTRPDNEMTCLRGSTVLNFTLTRE